MLLQGGGVITIQNDDGMVFDCIQFGELNRNHFSMVRSIALVAGYA